MSYDNFETVSFRLPKKEFPQFQRIADSLYNAGKCKSPKVSVMAKLFLYVMSNQFLKLEEQTKAVLAQQVAAGKAAVDE